MTVWMWGSLLVSSATLVALAAEWWWPFDLLTHFRVHYIWILTPLAIALLIARRYLVALIAGGCLLWNLALVVPDYFGPTPSAEGSVDIRLMTVNVCTSNRDYERFLAMIRAADPDVILLMEIDDDWLTALDQLRDDYPHSEIAPRADNFGIALLSKLPMETHRVRYVGSAGLPSIESRLLVGDTVFNFFGTHPLPPVNADNYSLRNEQLAATADLVARMEGPKIVAGDFNVTPWSPFFGRMLTRSGLRDSRRGFGVQATWPSHWGIGGIPIDHVLVSDDVAVKDRRVGPAFGSDHRAVIVDLIVGQKE